MFTSNMAILGSSHFYGNNMTGIDNLTRTFDNEWDESMWELVIEDFKQSQFTHKETTTIVLMCLYVPIFVTSLLGNALVLLVIVPNRRMWSVTNNFLVNLALADLLVTILCMPMTVARKVYLPWIYGDVLCKMTPYLQGVSVTCSTFTITAMSLDRCLAILHPMKFRNLRTKGNVRVLIIAVWLTSMLLMLPLIFVNQTKTQQIFDGIKITTCTEEWQSLFQRRAYDFSLLFIVCLIPAQIVFISYVLMGKRLWITDTQLKGNEESKYIHSGSNSEKNGDPVRANRRRIAKMCIVVSIIFVVCWLPYYTVNIYLDFKRDHSALDIVYWGLLVGHLHCITNPILYCFMHKSFRYCVKRFMPCWRARYLRTQSTYGASAFTRHRMGTFMTSGKTKSSSSMRKKDNSGKLDTPHLQRKSTGSTDDVDNCDKASRPEAGNVPNTRLHAGGVDRSTTDHDPPRRVKLIISRFRDKALRNRRSNTFKLVELAKSINVDNECQSQIKNDPIRQTVTLAT